MRVSCTALLVLNIQQGSCLRHRGSSMKEKRWNVWSPSCISVCEKSTLLRSIRTGVPVFMRPVRMPWLAMDSVSPVAAGSAIRPPGTCLRPMCISPLRKVPAVITTHLARSSAPQMVRTPWTSPSATISSFTWSCQMLRLGVFSSISRHAQMNLPLSHCARGLHTAGPLERLSMRNCMEHRSVTMPIMPPSASISRTICPLAMPPTAGLHDICAILFMSIVTRQVFAPSRAEAEAASQPAWPAPTTTTS